MNKKAQSGQLAMIFLILVFLINWAVWLGSWMNIVGEQTIISNNLTGVEAFFFANLNVLIFVGVMMGLMGFMYFGGRQ